jgi:hypothetical protein
MTKSTKNTASDATAAASEGLRAAFKTGADTLENALQEGAKAAAKGLEAMNITSKDGIVTGNEQFEQAAEHGRENLRTVTAAAEGFFKAAEEINTAYFAFAQKFAVAGIEATEAALGADPVDAGKIQGDFLQAGIAEWAAESTRLGEITFAAANRTMEPVNARMAKLVQAALRT